MSGSTMDPHDKMRARDVGKVARGEQAPRPPQRTPDVSRPPPPSSTSSKSESEGESGGKSKKEKMRHCYNTYFRYQRCIEENGAEAEACKKVADYYKSTCPEWIGEWKIK